METVILVAVLVTSLLSIVFLVALLTRKPANEGRQLETVVREDLRNGREEAARAARDLREEISAGQKTSVESLVKTIGEMGTAQAAQLDQFAKQLKGLTDSNETRLEKVRSTFENQMRQLQESNEKRLDQMRQTVDEKLQNTLEKRVIQIGERAPGSCTAWTRGDAEPGHRSRRPQACSQQREGPGNLG
jgi:DNA anti-recombination protein RmuC